MKILTNEFVYVVVPDYHPKVSHCQFITRETNAISLPSVNLAKSRWRLQRSQQKKTQNYQPP